MVTPKDTAEFIIGAISDIDACDGTVGMTKEEMKLDRASFAIEELLRQVKRDLLSIADKGEYEELRREVEDYFLFLK